MLVWAITALLVSPKVISRSSMEPALFPGDLVIVSMWPLGPRLPVSIGIPFTRIRLDAFSLPDWRLPGSETLEHGDIVVFNYPMDSAFIDRKRIQVKRCIGLPGDTVNLRRGQVYINGKLLSSPYTVRHNYKIYGPVGAFRTLCARIDPHNERSRSSNGDIHLLSMTAQEVTTFQPEFPDLRFHQAVLDPEEYPNDLYPALIQPDWTPDELGPIIVPAAGDSLVLDAVNLRYFDRAIAQYEGRQLSHSGDSIFIDGHYCTHYTFQQDYYFLMGDNRHNSIDSRHWGLVPKNHIIGRVALKLFSYRPNAPWYNKVRWDEILRKPL